MTSWLNTEQLARLADVHPDTLLAQARAGTLPAVRVGRQWRYPPDALERLPICRALGVTLQELLARADETDRRDLGLD